MKKYIYIAILSLIAILGITVGIQSYKIKEYKTNLTQSSATIAAYAAENSKMKESNREFQLTIDNLKYSTDSLMNKIDSARRALRIKDKEIKRLGYIASTAHRVDTIQFRDTIFKDPSFSIDTTITDNNGWYRCDVGLTYPNLISVEPTFKSEKFVITSVKKETVNPPKKCWIGRLFQKKHNVITIDVVENNPFINNDRERFITIVN